MNTPDITATRRHTPAVMIVLSGLGVFWIPGDFDVNRPAAEHRKRHPR
ncbi:hypothetical protein BJ970_004433 [Saccharopolyspora phatthalungensis]|uniref:Uncharacterized protein n=1 Tax=Saccharopolyspora phatthalungensis TaxID=664693 RepID=A0A840QE96_9PSEU|nr:hypothetical protein [Saccharopolyspora phatthalungensis]